MKQIFWMRYLSAALVFTPLMPVSSIQALPAPSSQTQAPSAYDQYMQQGYDATKRRNYSAALNYFKRALQARPGDKYSAAAVSNIGAHIARAPQTESQGKASLVYIPSNIGIPNRRTPGATRGGCTQEIKPLTAPTTQMNPLTALVPEMDPQLTTEGKPVFFFYIPQTSAQELELAMLDENDNLLGKNTIKPPIKPGIVSISPSADMLPLQVGKTYHWSFSVICDREDRSGSLVVQGSIQRITPDPNLTIELKKAKPQERATLYATAGLWQDSLATLAELRRDVPKDPEVKTDWEELLKSVGLEQFAQQPIEP